MNNYVLLVLDSCRYDTMEVVWGSLKNIPQIGRLQKGYSLSSWTLTSHIAFVIGRLPWIEKRTSLNTQKQDLSDLREWNKRLGIPLTSALGDNYDFRESLHEFGYQLKAIVSANPLGPETPFKYFVDNLVSVGKYDNVLERIIKEIKEVDCSGFNFFLLNTCETHYPYFDGAYDKRLLEYYIPGYRGQIRAARKGVSPSIPYFEKSLLQLFYNRQCSAIKYIDSLFPKLLTCFPEDTFITITSDHGDCLGEDGFVYHGEVAHKKVLEVPFIEGKIK